MSDYRDILDAKINSLQQGIDEIKIQIELITSHLKIKAEKQAKNKPRVTKDFTPPSEQEVIDFFNQKGYTEESAKTAFSYYDCAKWKDSSGKSVLNWKQKCISVWFKPENKSIGKADQGSMFKELY